MSARAILFRWKLNGKIDIYEALSHTDGRTIPDIFTEKGVEPWKMFQACSKGREEDG
jgi:hypothetical protein